MSYPEMQKLIAKLNALAPKGFKLKFDQNTTQVFNSIAKFLNKLDPLSWRRLFEEFKVNPQLFSDDLKTILKHYRHIKANYPGSRMADLSFTLKHQKP